MPADRPKSREISPIMLLDYEPLLRIQREIQVRDGKKPTSPVEIHPPRWSKYFWVTGVLWSSEALSRQVVREAVLNTPICTAFCVQHGQTRTLREMLHQEGRVMARAGSPGPALDPDDLAYTREVLSPYLDACDTRTCTECLFGDPAGRTLDFTPRGLSHWAGQALALALHDAQPEHVPQR